MKDGQMQDSNTGIENSGVEAIMWIQQEKTRKSTGIYSESAEGGANSRAARTGDRRSVYGK